jgi:NADH-quinone oxidoreductase subunit N
LFAQPVEAEGLVFGGMLSFDWPAFTFTVMLLFAAALTALFSMSVPVVSDRGEFYALLAASTLGLVLMSAASDLIMLFLAIETASISLYILAGFLKDDDKSTESGIKYFLFGAVVSAVMLYGFSLLYGFTGQTNIYALADSFLAGDLSPWVIGGIALFVLVGFGFKIAMAPMHFWTPDVYEGAPTSITAYISTASKAAGFIVLVRVMLVVFPSIEAQWALLIAILATATMTIGNLIAIAQKNIKRLLAYSSIAHAGYALIGLVALSVFGTASLVFYLLAYLVTNLAAFAIVILFARSAGSDEIEDYAGLSRRSPWLAMALLIAFLSLGGMPPLAGFMAKFFVFTAAVQSGWIWLAFVGVLNAIIGLYYYLTVLKVVYLYRSDDDDKPIAVPRTYAIGLVALIAAIIVIGVVSTPWLEWSINAAQSLF